MFFLRFCHFLHQRYKLCKIIFNRCPFRFDPKKTLPIAANAWKKNTMNNVHEWNFKTKKNTFRFIYFQKHCIKRFHACIDSPKSYSLSLRPYTPYDQNPYRGEMIANCIFIYQMILLAFLTSRTMSSVMHLINE